MTGTTVGSALLASTDPERLRAWYAAALGPERDDEIGGYRMLKFGAFYLMIDTRPDIGTRNPEPGRLIINFDVPDARAVARRMAELGATWLAELEDREGNLFATAVDPDGNYVQIIELSAATRAAMSG
jgi:predicted enzyme related to lactoylglutathione lyase